MNEYIEKYEKNKTLTFMYSGNIGLYYDLENIIKIIGEFKENTNVQFVFVGEGAHRKTLDDYCSINQIKNVKFFLIMFLKAKFSVLLTQQMSIL